MNFAEFDSSLEQNTPPAGLGPLLLALWWDARQDWGRAHEIAQEIETPEGAWVHAYLHRKEGDEANSGYWYRRAARPYSRLPLCEEWKQIVKRLLENPT